MFIIRKKTKIEGHIRVLIGESYRENGKIKQRILRNVGTAHNSIDLERYEKVAVLMIEEEIKKKNKCDLLLNYSGEIDEIPLNNNTAFEFKSNDIREIKRIEDGMPEIYGELFDSLGFNNILQNQNHTKILKDLVTLRIFNPQSKHKSQEILKEKMDKETSLSSIYRMLDSLSKNEDKVIKSAFHAAQRLFPEKKIDLLFFDVTTLYFESTEKDEDLKAFGFSKDCKFNQVQVVLALATTHEGLPIGYKIFKGNTAEVKTLIACIDDWKKTISIENVIFVADRAMFSKENLYELNSRNYTFIIAAKLRSLSLEYKNKVLSQEGYQIKESNNNIVWIKEVPLKMEHKIKAENKSLKKDIIGRLICSYSSSRAKKDRSDREKMLDKISKYLNKDTGKTTTKRMVTNACLKKFCKFEGDSAAKLDQEKVTMDELWDGMHGIFTNSDRDPNELLSRYSELWQIEETFRITKHDLKVRPIYHYKPSRIRAHIALCFLSLTLMRYLHITLKRKNINISMNKLNEELRKIQYSVCKDIHTGLLLKIPSAQTPIAKQIYAAMGLKRNDKVTYHKQ
jgi:transposase